MMTNKQDNSGGDLADIKAMLADMQARLSTQEERNKELEADNRNLRVELDNEKRGRPVEKSSVAERKREMFRESAWKQGPFRYELQFVFKNRTGTRDGSGKRLPLSFQTFNIQTQYDAGVEVGEEVTGEALQDLLHTYNKETKSKLEPEATIAKFVGKFAPEEQPLAVA